MTKMRQGGCRCGKARYEIDLAGAHTLVCHCQDCQRHLGAPYSVFTIVPADQFRWIARPDGTIAFSESADRLFCSTCGTYLKWEGKDSEHGAEVNAMTLDDPGLISPDEEIYTRSRLAWVAPIDGIPQHIAGRG